jgi:cell shape-determining protein MreC
MNSMTEAVVTILTAVIGVAIISVLVSRKSNTTGVLQAGGNAFSSILGVAVSPVTGAISTPTSPMGGYGGAAMLLN